MGKAIVNTTISQLISAVAVLKKYAVFMNSKIDVTFFDVTQWR